MHLGSKCYTKAILLPINQSMRLISPVILHPMSDGYVQQQDTEEMNVEDILTLQQSKGANKKQTMKDNSLSKAPRAPAWQQPPSPQSM